MGTTVVDPEGKEVGAVDDLIFDEQKKIVGVVVGVGGFLGIGKKDVGLDWQQAKLQHDVICFTAGKETTCCAIAECRGAHRRRLTFLPIPLCIIALRGSDRRSRG